MDMNSLKALFNKSNTKILIITPLFPMLVSLRFGEFLIFAFPLSLIVGFIYRPRKIWFLWIFSTVLLNVVYGTAALLQLIPGPETDPSQGETVWTFLGESPIWMAMLVAIPMFVGRFLGRKFKKN